MSGMPARTMSQDADEAMSLAGTEPRRAIQIAQRAVRLARREQRADVGSVAERAWGHALLFCGDMDRAIRHLRQAVALGEQAKSAVLVAEARMTLSYALVQRGRPRAALIEINAALPDLQGVTGARALAQRGLILRLSNRAHDSLDDLNKALVVLRRAGDGVLIQRLLINRAMTFVEIGALTSARDDLVEAHELAEQHGQGLNLGLIAENSGVVEVLAGDVPAALRHFDEAQRLIPAHGARLTALYRDRADLLLSVGLLTEAGAAAERAIEALRQQRRFLLIPEARLTLTHAAFLDRNWAVTMQQARRAQREFDRQQRPDRSAHARLFVLRAQLAAGIVPRVALTEVQAIADIMARTNQPAEAIEAHLIAAQLSKRPADHLRGAAQIARRGPAMVRARSRYAEALLHVHQADPGKAMAAARAGLRILDEHNAALGATDLRANAALHRRDLVAIGMRTALTEGRLGTIFEWAERGRASQLLHPPVNPPADPVLARLLAELRMIARDLYRAGASPQLLRRQAGLERRIRDHTRLRSPGAPGRPPLAPVPAAAMGQALDDSALVEYIDVDAELMALTMVGGRLRIHRLGQTADVASLIERIRFALHRLARRPVGPRGQSGTVHAALDLLRGAADRLDVQLLAPLPELADRPLVIVPTGPLHSMPWSTLPSLIGRPIAVSPSATLWHAANTATAPNDRHALPTPGPSQPTPASDHVSGTATSTPDHRVTAASTPDHRVFVAAGPDLSGASDEASAVAALHGVKPLLGDAASVEAVLTALANADLVHLAAHGRLRSDNPLFSDLRLADGPLVVHDIEQLPRVPHTVVLAACDSARSVVKTGDELLGLSATIIAQGTAQLIASVVPIPDAATKPLMVAFHQLLTNGTPAATALAAAQARMRDAEPAARAAAAGFICLGLNR
jgi:tetratricopeptide (TPR) repeat protein